MIRNQHPSLPKHQHPQARPIATVPHERFTVHVGGDAVEERGHGRIVHEGTPIVTYLAVEDATYAAREDYGHRAGAYVTRESDGAVVCVTAPGKPFAWMHNLGFGAQGGSPDVVRG